MIENIEEVLLRNGKVNRVIFYYNQTRYGAEISDEKILFSRMLNASGCYEINAHIAVHKMKTGKTLWTVKHCCGLQGFGMGTDDVCYACETPGQEMEATPENQSKLRVYGEYTPELAKIIPDEILRYCKKLEELV